MPKATSDGQLYTKMANKIWFRRDPVGSTNYGVISFGLIREPASPSLNVDSFDLRDPANCNALVWQDTNEVTEEWLAKTANISMENLSMYFLADPPTQVEQAATALTDVAHDNAIVGDIIKVVNADGDSVFRLTSVDAVKDGVTTLASDDWEVVDLEAGLIRLLAGGTEGYTDGEEVDITVTVTPVATTLIVATPQTAGLLNGYGWIQMQSTCGEEKWIREGRMSVRPSTTNFSASDASDIDFTITALTDSTNTANPAGKLTKIKGNLI